MIDEQQADAQIEQRTSGRIRRSAIIIVLVALVIGTGLYLHGKTISSPVAKALADELGADTPVYRRNWVSRSEIVFDVRSVDGNISMADMTRRFLKAAESLKDQDFDRVYLAHRGDEKFAFEGAYFKKLGEERGWQNPVYTIRTMPENVQNLDGTQAFAGWTGGWLGVMGKQLEDSNEFHRQWWVSNELSEIRE